LINRKERKRRDRIGGIFQYDFVHPDGQTIDFTTKDTKVRRLPIGGAFGMRDEAASNKEDSIHVTARRSLARLRTRHFVRHLQPCFGHRQHARCASVAVGFGALDDDCQSGGYFKEEGIDVEFLSIRGEIAIRTTLAGEIDFFTNAGSALAAVARSVPGRILTVFQDKPGWDLIALPSIKSIAQLRG
jgi:hypothetical protein